MSDSFLLGVPTQDRADLEKLREETGTTAQIAEHRYFDAAAFVEMLVSTELLTSGVIITWIRSRASVRKATRLSFRGVEVEALSLKDMERIIKYISEILGEEDDPGV